MLEILFLVRFCRRLSSIAKQKRRSGAWGALGAGFWIGGEIVGFAVGAATSDDLGAGAYLVALVFAAVGAVIAYVIVKSLRSLEPQRFDATPSDAAFAARAMALPAQAVDVSNPYAPPRAQ